MKKPQTNHVFVYNLGVDNLGLAVTVVHRFNVII